MKKSCFKGCFCSKAFTLVELLVVVLIIGVLAAVAVPQYQKVIVKNKYTYVKMVGQAIARAQDLFYLEKGQYSNGFSSLTIDMPREGFNEEKSNDGKYVYNWGYCVLNNRVAVECFLDKERMKFMMYYNHINSAHKGERSCGVYQELNTRRDVQHKVCSQETNRTSPSSGPHQSGENRHYLYEYK